MRNRILNILQEIKSYLSQDLKSLDQKILDYFAKKEQLIRIIGEYIVSSGGKKIRSIFALLNFKMLSKDSEVDSKVITSCAAIELIHMATLLHDDVVDGSKTRRSLPAANVLWGVNASILVGDFLLSQAFNFLVSVGSIEVLDTLAKASSLIIEGEVVQLSQLSKGVDFSREKYFQIIDLKASELFAAAFTISTILSSRKEYLEILKQYGLLVGRIFQITDDLMDYDFNSKHLGKSPGDDFKEGKITMPLIILYELMSKLEKNKLTKILQNPTKNKEDFIWVKENIIKYNINTHIKEIIQKFEQNALMILSKLQINDINFSYIVKLTKFIVHRID